jgi:hypothetical protein
MTSLLGNAVPSPDRNNSYLQFSDLNYWYLRPDLELSEVRPFLNPQREVRGSPEDRILENKTTSQEESSAQKIYERFKASPTMETKLDSIVVHSENPIIRRAKTIERSETLERRSLRPGFEYQKTMMHLDKLNALRLTLRRAPKKYSYLREAQNWFVASWQEKAIEYYQWGLSGASHGAVITISVELGRRRKLSPEEKNLITEIACSTTFEIAALTCARKYLK